MNTRVCPRKLADDLCRRSLHSRYMLAAVAVDRGGHIFAWGWNHGTIHAEAHMLVGANRCRMNGATVIVAGRKRKSGRPLTARPCARCEQLLYTVGVKTVVYSVYVLDVLEPQWVEERMNNV